MTTIIRSAVVMALVALAVPAAAQPVAISFADLPRTVRVGQEVVIRDNDGKKTKGLVAAISGSSLRLDVPKNKRNPTGIATFAEADVARIARTDKVGNGALIGLGIGTGLGVAVAEGSCGDYEECHAMARAVGYGVFIPLGAIAGAVVDKFIGPKTVFLSSDRRVRSMTVEPVLARNRAALAVALRF
jgi:hypothetical protein